MPRPALLDPTAAIGFGCDRCKEQSTTLDAGRLATLDVGRARVAQASLDEGGTAA